MVTLRSLLCSAALTGALLASAPARAQSDTLAQARAAIDEVRYDRAQALLTEALREGGRSRAEVLEIYRLAASTAVVMGQPDVAEQFYRRLLALDPTATLSDDLAPKLKQPFAAAASYIDAHGAVRGRARLLPDGGIEVVVESDPLKMVDAAAPGSAAATALDADRRAILRAPGPVDRIVLLDDRRNELLILTAPVPALPAPAAATTRPARPSLVRTWWVWAIPAGAALAVGVGAGIAAQSASDDLDSGLLFGRLYYDEAKELRSTIDTRATIANVSFATAGVFAAVAGVMWLTRPKEQPAIAVLPLLAPGDGAGVALRGSWR